MGKVPFYVETIHGIELREPLFEEQQQWVRREDYEAALAAQSAEIARLSVALAAAQESITAGHEVVVLRDAEIARLRDAALKLNGALDDYWNAGLSRKDAHVWAITYGQQLLLAALTPQPGAAAEGGK
jgi:phosphoserine aminotransferase